MLLKNFIAGIGIIVLIGCAHSGARPDLFKPPFDLKKQAPVPSKSTFLGFDEQDDDIRYGATRRYKSLESREDLASYYRETLPEYGLVETQYREDDATTTIDFSGWPGKKKLSISIIDNGLYYVFPGRYQRTEKESDDFREFSISVSGPPASGKRR